MTDFLLLEQLHKIIKELPRPRLMFRKGISVRGFFRPYMSLSEYTAASIFKTPDEITPVKVRFASMVGNKGIADTMRNIKGMSVKFMEGECPYDMICHSIPVQFINEISNVLDMFAMFQKREVFDGINKEKFWKFITENPEAINGALHLYSHEGLTDSYINIKWYSVNSMIWQSSEGNNYMVRYKWVPFKEGKFMSAKTLTRTSAEFMAGYAPDIAQEELLCSLRDKKFPAFELLVQMIDMNEIINDEYKKHTLIWEDEHIPYMAVGMMMLDDLADRENIDDESIFFDPASTINGIESYNDELIDYMAYLCRIEALERGTV